MKMRTKMLDGSDFFLGSSIVRVTKFTWPEVRIVVLSALSPKLRVNEPSFFSSNVFWSHSNVASGK